MEARIEFLELRIKQISIQLQGLEVAISQLFRLVCEPLEPPPALYPACVPIKVAVPPELLYPA